MPALVNAAKHAGVTTVSLYAETEPDAVSIFVKDRGVGFAQKPAHGLDPRRPKPSVRELRQEPVSVFRLNDSDYKLHDVIPSRGAIARQISSDS